MESSSNGVRVRVEWSGVEWNGIMESNGMEWVEWNGRVDGVEWRDCVSGWWMWWYGVVWCEW